MLSIGTFPKTQAIWTKYCIYIYILVNLVCAQYWCPLFCIQYCQKYFDNLPWLFKPFKFGNGSRVSDKKLIILEFKYLQNKKKV